MLPSISRRELLAAGAAASMPLLGSAAEPSARSPVEPFRFSLNTSTIRGQKVPMPETVALTAKAGYDALEPWINQLDEYHKNGGSLKDLGKRIADAGLVVPSAIGFCEWVVDDDARRQKGLEQARRDMDMVQQIGGKRLAAPPVGATQGGSLDLLKAAERYRALLEIGDQIGVTPQVEVWGFSKNLSRLGETALVAIESKHPRACVLADVYHLYKGGSDFEGLRLLSAGAMQVFHMNDYPTDPPRATIKDANRVYPGDGVAPLKTMLRELRQLGFRGYLSLELFNPDYWKQDAFLVARTGLEKMKAVVSAAMA